MAKPIFGSFCFSCYVNFPGKDMDNMEKILNKDSKKKPK